MVRPSPDAAYRRTRLFILTLGYSRKAVRLLTWSSSAQTWAELHERAFRRLGGSTRVVQPGQSLWAIAQGLFGGPASIAQVAFKVDRLWQLNADRIGSGNPDLIFPGLRLRLK